MSYQEILGIGPECYSCIYNSLLNDEEISNGDPYTAFCNYISQDAEYSFTLCVSENNVTDCGIDVTTFLNYLEAFCASFGNGTLSVGNTTLTTVPTIPTTSTIISTTPPTTPTTSTIISTTPPTTPTTPITISTTSSTTQASQSNIIPQSTSTSTTSQATTTTTKTSSTPSTAPPTSSYSSTQTTKSTQTPATSTSTQLPTISQTTSSALSLHYTVSISSIGFTSSTPTHSSLPAYTGSGDLLRGYCTTPFFTLIPGPTADLYIGVIGCVNGKDDCCPFSVASTHASTATETTTETLTTTGTVTIESFVTITLGSTSPISISTSQTLANINQNQAFPTPNQPSEATLAYCPGDYQTVSTACCPSNYLLWTTMLGGQTPCYSTVSAFLDPPALPIPTTTSTISPLPTSTIVNVIYAMAYPVNPPSPGLTPDAKAGVGAGTGVFAIVMLFAIAAYLLRRRRDRKISSPLNSTERQSTADMAATESSISPVSELHHSSFPYPQPGAFDRDSSTVSVPPPLSEPVSGYAIFHHPAREQRPSQRRPVPVPVSTEVPAQSASSSLWPRVEMDSYHTPVNFGLPPGELFGGHVEQRQELQDQNWSP